MTDDPRERPPEAPDPVTVTDADLFEGRSPLDAAASFDARPEPAAARPAGPHAGRSRRRLDLEPDTVERDLVKLVLTVVELLRQLMERQAVRRFDEGDLTEEQEERVGLTLMLLEDRMAELRNRYGLRPEDLNLDLGPLGPLLPRD
ncbi:gas vesicle protein K [Streptomyces sp. MA15]|uniref:gas vesicle protein K n=1 Tax=Streptomyces sp. MA15 TaxID=3055061 RepID=UPI0025B00AE2|nr:gas vesicle protein K [Streptomyces sp. MA15]MDN3268823.1 gas vesicle protein K [Streptomyces sp. MA15]